MDIIRMFTCQATATLVRLGHYKAKSNAKWLWNKADHYRQLVDECVALAKASNSNEIRAEHYATAEYYLHLADVEANLTGQLSTYWRA
jgi:hypothetical protein